MLAAVAQLLFCLALKLGYASHLVHVLTAYYAAPAVPNSFPPVMPKQELTIKITADLP